jgi:flagellar basal body-associated protein FliL
VNNKRMAIIVIVGMIFMASVLTMSVFGQGDETQQKAAGAIQYKLVPVPNVQTQAQLQALMTAQGNGGWRYVSAFAVGTGPIPNQVVFLFSKP